MYIEFLGNIKNIQFRKKEAKRFNSMIWPFIRHRTHKIGTFKLIHIVIKMILPPYLNQFFNGPVGGRILNTAFLRKSYHQDVPVYHTQTTDAIRPAM